MEHEVGREARVEMGEQVGRNFTIFQVEFDGSSPLRWWQWTWARVDRLEIYVGGNHGFWNSDIGKLLPCLDPSLEV